MCLFASKSKRERESTSVLQKLEHNLLLLLGEPFLIHRLVQQSDDVREDLVRCDRRRVVLNDFALVVKEELGEIPGDVATLERGVLSEPLEQRDGVRTVDIDLRHHRERNVVRRLGPLLDLLIRARLLSSKLVARERINLKTLAVILLVDGFHLRVVHIRQTSLACDVDDVVGFVALAEVDRDVVNVLRREVEQRLAARRHEKKRQHQSELAPLHFWV
jgi:hypothetical protein